MLITVVNGFVHPLGSFGAFVCSFSEEIRSLRSSCVSLLMKLFSFRLTFTPPVLCWSLKLHERWRHLTISAEYSNPRRASLDNFPIKSPTFQFQISAVCFRYANDSIWMINPFVIDSHLSGILLILFLQLNVWNFSIFQLNRPLSGGNLADGNGLSWGYDLINRLGRVLGVKKKGGREALIQPSSKFISWYISIIFTSGSLKPHAHWTGHRSWMLIGPLIHHSPSFLYQFSFFFYKIFPLI